MDIYLGSSPQLERDDQLPATNLLDIVGHLSACSIMDFKIHFKTQKSKVEAFRTETLGNDKAAIASLQDKIHFRDLLEDAKEKYINLQQLWGKNPQSKEQALISQVKALQARLDKFDQQLQVLFQLRWRKPLGQHLSQTKEEWIQLVANNHSKSVLLTNPLFELVWQLVL